MADQYVHQLARDWRSAVLSPIDQTLCQYAEKLTLSPGEMTVGDLQSLRAHGLSDRAIHDATQVVSYFNYINRIAEGLGVDAEEFVRPWEKSAVETSAADQ